MKYSKASFRILSNVFDTMNKRGISTIIVTVILVAVVLIAVGIVWAVISNILTENKEDISLERLTIDADIDGVTINESANNISVLVRRNPGQGNLIGFKFLFKSSIDAELHTIYVTMDELEERIFTFHLNMDVSTVLTITIIPIIKSGDKEIFGTGKVYTIKIEENIPKQILGNNISFGEEYVFNIPRSYSLSSFALNSTSFIIGYSNHFSNGTAIVGTISGNTISFGDQYLFNEGTTSSISISMLNSTSFVMVYRDHSNSYYGTAVIGTISGTEISYGNEYVFNTANTRYISVSTLNSTSFVVSFSNNTNSYGASVVGMVSGTDISYGNQYIFETGGMYYLDVSALDSDTFVIGYDAESNEYNGTTIIGTVSGTSISYGNKYVFNPAGTEYISVFPLNSDSFIVSFSDIPNSYRGTAMIGTLSGTEISYGNEYVFSTSDAYQITLSLLDSNSFITSSISVPNYGCSVIGTISGENISYGNEYIFESANVANPFVVALNSTSFVVSYSNTTTGYSGVSIPGYRF